jgi:hypothetical protein
VFGPAASSVRIASRNMTGRRPPPYAYPTKLHLAS